MLSERTVILDCGASRTALGVFRFQGGRLRLDFLAVENLARSDGQDDNWLDGTRTALAALSARVKLAGPVGLVLPAHLVLTKHIGAPRAAASKRAKVIRFAAEQSIPFALADVVWDSVVVGERAGELELLLVAAKLDTIESIVAVVQAAGFEPQLVVPAPLATLAAYREEYPGGKETSLVLDLGQRSTTLLLVEPGRFRLRTFSLGGSSIPPQVAGLQPGLLDAVATRLSQEITRTLLYFRRQGEMAQPGRIHLAGEGAVLAGLGHSLEARLKLPVCHLDATAVLATRVGAAADESIRDAGELTILTGAAAMQLRPNHPRLDLLPPRLRRQVGYRRRQPWLIATAGLAVATLLPPVMHYRQVGEAARHKAAAIESELGLLRERAARNCARLQQLTEIRQEATRLQDIMDRRASWLHLLADLQDRLVRVEDVWLDELKVSPAAPGKPLRLHISGRMLDKTTPPSPVSPETIGRIKILLREFNASPYVQVAEEGRRFDTSQPGVLKFGCMLAASPARPF